MTRRIAWVVSTSAMRVAVIAVALSACQGGAATTDALDGAALSDGAAPPDLSAVVLDMASSALDLAATLDGPARPTDLAPIAADLASPSPSGRLFPDGAPWFQDVSQAALDGESAQVVAALQAAGGWGTGLTRFQIDFSLEVLEADVNTPKLPFTRTGDWYTPDCDFQTVPVPAGGVLEGEAGYRCLSDGDCHLLVVDRPTRRLYEMWRADINAGVFNGGCLAVWDMDRVYPPSGRGEQCTSADAAGFPIAPLLPTADEVAAGEVKHALRFILPNARMRRRIYVHPATHSTGPTAGGPTMPPYGARFRLRANYPLQNLRNDSARVIARALQKYGMLLSDGGNVPLTFRSDRGTKAKWADIGIDSRVFDGVQASDFEMVEGGMRYMWTGDCARNP